MIGERVELNEYVYARYDGRNIILTEKTPNCQHVTLNSEALANLEIFKQKVLAWIER